MKSLNIFVLASKKYDPMSRAIFSLTAVGILGLGGYALKERISVSPERVTLAARVVDRIINRAQESLGSSKTHNTQDSAPVFLTIDESRTKMQKDLTQNIWSHIRNGALDTDSLAREIPTLSRDEQKMLIDLLSEKNLLRRIFFKKGVFEKLSPTEIIEATTTSMSRDREESRELFSSLIAEGLISKDALFAHLLRGAFIGHVALTNLDIFFKDGGDGLRDILAGSNTSLKRDLLLHYSVLQHVFSQSEYTSILFELRNQGLIPPAIFLAPTVIEPSLVTAPIDRAAELQALHNRGEYLQILERANEFELTQVMRDSYARLILGRVGDYFEWGVFMTLVKNGVVSVEIYPQLLQLLVSHNALKYAQYSDMFVDWYGRRHFIQEMIAVGDIENFAQYPAQIQLTLFEVDQILSILQANNTLSNIAVLLKYRTTLLTNDPVFPHPSQY